MSMAPWPPQPSDPSGPPLHGAWLTTLRGDGIEALSGLGLDWLGVDLQHGSLGAGDLPDLVRAADLTGTPVLVRVPSHDPAVIGRSLDAGAAGVIVPSVHSAAEAGALVEAVRMPPVGRRSSGTSRTAYPSAPTRPAAILLPMIESAEGLAAVSDIAAVPGVDGLFLGPYDLTLAMGLPSTTDPAGIAARATVVAAARSRGLLAGAFAGDPALLETFPPLDLVAVDTDLGMLRAGAELRLEHARRTAGPPQE